MTVRTDTSETQPAKAQKDTILPTSEVPLDHTVESQVVLFRREISSAMQQGFISETEAERWIHQGVENIIRTEKDPGEMQKQISELQGFLHQHIAIHQENNALRRQLEERIVESGVFDPESRNQWLSAVDYAQQRYQSGEIPLKQSQMEIRSLVDSLPQFILSGHKNAEEFRKLAEAVEKSDLPMVKIARDQVPDIGRFLQLPYPFRVEIVKKLHGQIESEVAHFLAQFSEYAKQIGAQEKLESAKSAEQKLSVLAGLYRNLGNSEKKRLEEKAEIVDLVNKKAWSLAKEKIVPLHKKLNEKTYQFYGFDELEKQVRERLDAQAKLLQQSDVQQKNEEWEAAILSLEAAQAIEPLPNFETRRLDLQKKLTAEKMLQQARTLVAEQKEEEARKLQEQALELDPALESRLVVPRKSEEVAEKKEVTARAELKQILATDEEAGTLRAESQLIREVKIRKEEAGVETVTEESGSAIARSQKSVEGESEKLKVQKEVVRKTESLDRDKASDATLVSLRVRKSNKKENVSRTVKDIQEGKRKVSTVSFQQGDEVSENVSVEKALALHAEKAGRWMQENIALIDKKHGVTLSARKEEFDLAA